MSKFTSGPWSYDANDKLSANRAFGIVVPWEDGGEVGTVVVAEVCESNVDGQSEADAALIAAAPEMFDVLKSIGMVHDIDMAIGRDRWMRLAEVMKKADPTSTSILDLPEPPLPWVLRAKKGGAVCTQ